MGTQEAGADSVRCMMFMLWTLLIFSRALCFEVTETQEETDNITTLYPITIKNDTNRNSTQAKTNDSLKTGTSFTETLTNDEGDKKTQSKEESVIEKPGNTSKEFKPSVHFENFFDEDSFGPMQLPTKPTLDRFSPLKKPPSAFVGSQKDEFNTIHTPKRERFPYRYESPILTRAKSKWRPTSEIESKPTSSVPVQVPAGRLYNKPDAFKDKPGDDDDFGLEFNDDSEKIVTKRRNPWKGLLHLLTAFIPVGLIISALTPNIITVHDTGLPPGTPPGAQPGAAGVNNIMPPRLFRRSSEDLSARLPPPPRLPPAVSEPCRRRLLCELHSEKNYHDQRSNRRGRACHKLPCDEPAAVAQALRWLLERRAPA